MATRLPETVTRNAMAEMFGVSPQRVGQLAALGVFKKAPNGGYFIEGAVPAYVEFRAAAAAKRKHPELDRAKQLEFERVVAKLRREDAQLITMKETLETAEDMIAKFLVAYRSIPGRLAEGSALRKSLESAMPEYVAELQKQLREQVEALKAGREYT